MGTIWEQQGLEVQYVSKRSDEDDSRVQVSNVRGYDRTGNIIADLILDFVYSLKALSRVHKTDVLVMNTFFAPILCPLFRRKVRLTVYNVARFPKKQFFLYRGVDLFCCVSGAVYNELLCQETWTKPKARVIHNPIDTRIFTPHGENCWTNDIKVVYSGRINKEKGLDILVGAIDRLRCRHRVSLRLIGPRDIEQGGSGKDYVTTLDAMCHGWSIDWVDPIPDSRALAEELAKANIFCYPSVAERGETFGVAPLEAMGLGLVPVVSSLDCFKEFVEPGVNGLVFDHREQATEHLVEVMELLLSDEEKFVRMSRAAIETSRSFSVEKIAKEYLNTFGESLERE